MLACYRIFFWYFFTFYSLFAHGANEQNLEHLTDSNTLHTLKGKNPELWNAMGMDILLDQVASEDRCHWLGRCFQKEENCGKYCGWIFCTPLYVFWAYTYPDFRCRPKVVDCFSNKQGYSKILTKELDHGTQSVAGISCFSELLDVDQLTTSLSRSGIPEDWFSNNLMWNIIAVSNGVAIYRMVNGCTSAEDTIFPQVNQYHINVTTWLLNNNLRAELTSPQYNNCLFDCLARNNFSTNINIFKKLICQSIKITLKEREQEDTFSRMANNEPLPYIDDLEPNPRNELDSVTNSIESDSPNSDLPVTENILQIQIQDYFQNIYSSSTPELQSLLSDLERNSHQSDQISQLFSYITGRNVLVIGQRPETYTMTGLLYTPDGSILPKGPEILQTEGVFENLENPIVIIHSTNHYITALPVQREELLPSASTSGRGEAGYDGSACLEMCGHRSSSD